MTLTSQPHERNIEAHLDRYVHRELLRFLACGSVDDGKSTLIGRLLHDSQMVYDDQLAAVRRDSSKHGTTGDDIDLALLTDGLQAEREQGITIDVAYRYFATQKRKFIIADTPGHEQYTRNMATGASTCNLAVILVDARHGVLDQTRRHAFIVSLLGIRHIVVAVNKMDLVRFSKDRFEEIREQFTSFAAKLQVSDIRFIPISALGGDNVVHRSDRMPWYESGPLLDYLETVHIASDLNLIDLRFPVQTVIRPHADYRGYCGTIASGVVRPGDEVMVIPSALRTRIRSIDTFDGPVQLAHAPMAVTLTLDDEIDVSRGDMIVHPNNVPHLSHQFEAMIVWMHAQPLEPNRQYLLKQATVQTPAVVQEIRYRINVGNLHRENATSLGLNEIGRVSVEAPRRIAFDPYSVNRTTGSFILIDRITNATLGAGMILDRDPAAAITTRPRSVDAGSNVRVQRGRISPQARRERLRQDPFTLWLTGLPRAGKTSIAYALEADLFARGLHVQVLDGENLRLGINADLGFSVGDRAENIRRAAEMAKMANDLGLIAIAPLVSATAKDRANARRIIGEDRYVEVFCNASIEVCEQRDRDDLFGRARRGELRNVTGIDFPFEPPSKPDVEVRTDALSVDQSVARIVAELTRLKKLPE